MLKPGLSQIENAFQPAKEISTSERFAGRKDAVADAYYGLIADGAHMAIVGNRGIGKTSLARQVLNMAKGDNSLLHKLDLSSDRELDFLSVYFACGTTTTNTTDLLERLLTSSKCLGDWLYDIPKASKEIRGYTPKFGANFLGVEVGRLGAEKKKEVTTEPALPSHSIDTVFTNALAAVVEQNLSEDGILIVIDEFDQISDPSGFASFLKAISTNVPKVKFCIVGVAQDIQVSDERASIFRLALCGNH